jgi:GNAT superfamily N-acetyltransferase
MPLALRHRTDVVAPLSPLAGLTVYRETDPAVMAALQGRAESDIQKRFDEGHRAYVARMDGAPAAWGWVATSRATIGELETSFAINHGERYLWNFVTLKSHRGLGIYPRLVNAIVDAEASEAERFWIAYAPENHASGSGIRKAGFTTVAEISFDHAGRPALRPSVTGGSSQPTHQLLDLPVLEEALAQCWRCVRMGKTPEQSCKPDMCKCDYQRPEQGCAA